MSAFFGKQRWNMSVMMCLFMFSIWRIHQFSQTLKLKKRNQRSILQVGFFFPFPFISWGGCARTSRGSSGESRPSKKDGIFHPTLPQFPAITTIRQVLLVIGNDHSTGAPMWFDLQKRERWIMPRVGGNELLSLDPISCSFCYYSRFCLLSFRFLMSCSPQL